MTGRIRVAGAIVATIVIAAACKPTGIRPNASTPPIDSADQVMTKMVTNMVENGVRTGNVYAETAYVYQASQRMDLRHLRVIFFKDGAQSSVLTAQRGDYQINTGSLDAHGDVRVESNDGRKLATPHLIYDKSSLQLRSDTIFTYDSKDEHLTGKSFISDLEFRNVDVLQPKGHQRGPGVPIKEQ